MAEDDKQDLHDILIEETTRGQKHSKKALSFARQRMIRRVGRLLADPNRATRQLFWKLLGRSGCQTNLLSFGNSSCCGGGATGTGSGYPFGCPDASVLLFRRQSRKMSRYDLCELLIELSGGNLPFLFL